MEFLPDRFFSCKLASDQIFGGEASRGKEKQTCAARWPHGERN
jgi:hypothetical protein